MTSDSYSVEVPDVEYWKRQIKCQYTCPVHTDARGYVGAIADGDYEKAYLIARGPNPLASICGRICAAPCEMSCRRADLDESVSIRALKRFVTEKFGAESGRYTWRAPNLLDVVVREESRQFRHSEDAVDLVESLTVDQTSHCRDIEEIKNLLEQFQTPAITADSSTVGIIGSGPAGLAAAHDLCLMGLKPVIYEAESVPGGMLYLGIPEYRLPRDLIEAEIGVIQMMGANIICNTEIGKDITFSELRSRHAAVLIAVGAKKSRKIPIPNIDAAGVSGGIDFLREVALRRDLKLGAKVVVIGGGNVAYDVARTLVRQTGYDVSVTARRQKGVEEVHLVCLESLKEMPADLHEVREGEEEGVTRHNSWGPKEILVDDNEHVRGVVFQRCVSILDEQKRFSPRFDENVVMTLPADQVFITVGQTADLSFIDAEDILLNEHDQPKLPSSFANAEAVGVFAAGDVAHGPKLMIDAIAGGKQVARKIYTYLNKKDFFRKTSTTHVEIKNFRRPQGYECLHREGIPVLPPEDRKKALNQVVESGYRLDQGKRQADRCLDCAVNTIFDSSKCVLCGGCSDVCPQNCLKLVPIEHLQGDQTFWQLLDRCFDRGADTGGSAIIKDETICIRCGLCAERCPAGAITMESFNFQEDWVDED